jgi:DNA polymerase
MTQNKESQQEFSDLVKEAKSLLKSLQASGIKELPAASELSSLAEKEKILAPIKAKAMACTDCRLCKTRKSVVFSDGSLGAELVFVGEGPGRDEDEQGVPFVGAAGKLLTKIIEAMKMKREEVYICNVVKCRPPQNRPPEPDEIAACSGYLEAQLLTIRPKVICVLGKTAAWALLETQAPLGALRGKTLEWKGIPLIVTYHPAYLLRNPAAKKDVWEDMKIVLQLLAKE